MDAEELRQEWESGESTGMRPARVQEVRADIYRVTGEPIPRSRVEIENWLEKKKSHVTQLLREADDEEQDEEQDSG